VQELRNGNADRDPDSYADADIIENGGPKRGSQTHANGYSCRYGHAPPWPPGMARLGQAGLSSDIGRIELANQASQGGYFG